MTLSFSTKAETLALLEEHVRSSSIAPLVYFTFSNWRAEREAVLERINAKFEGDLVIVRSSCQREDSVTGSNAGAFLSLPDVSIESVADAVDQVFASYGTPTESDQVLIQPMLDGVIRSGVAFSHDPNTCAPYRTVNWAEGGDTTVVTGGKGGRTWQQAGLSPIETPQKHVGVISLIEELLILFGGKAIDCEFAVTENPAGQQTVWLLQARELLLSRSPEDPKAQAERIDRIFAKVQDGMRSHPFLMGKNTAYGVMPDWNPAEIIGMRPKPLALSLYRELITDSVWAYQRHNYGYRNLRSFPLMRHFSGLPYIDVRLSFNSFIPADLDEGIASRLVDYYVDRLLAEPELHDKVEFEVVFSCYSLDLPERLERLSEAGFSKSDRDKIADSLRRLTNRIVHSKDGLWRKDASKLDTLNKRREELMSSDAGILERIYWLIEDGKRYGTLPFAGLARAGFVSLQLLQSLVAKGIFSRQDYDAFLASVSTVSSQLARDRVTLDKATFLSRYGHLRPGTYDILSSRYDESPDLYFDWDAPPRPAPVTKDFHISLGQMRTVAGALTEHGLEIDPVELFDFLQAGIELRELAKFHFTRNLSDALALIGEYGKQKGFAREDLAYSEISVFQELYAAAVNPGDIINSSIEQGKKRYSETLSVSLPPVISRPEDVWAFEWPDTIPNFITQKQVTAAVVGCDDPASLKGAIVCIPNADPGFDWLFSHQIAGFITAWGGVNSHMAIRAGELGLPAVIGAGEVLYRQWSAARRLHIDCAGRKVEVLS